MRKLSAIMFTDIVGYSVLMSKDESLALRVLETNRQILQTALSAHNGEFIKEIGDGTLCIFQSSWDAVNCAIAIQVAMANEDAFRLRIGIHIGDIVVTDNDVFGDSVNIASRIETICEPGGICFSQRVFEDIRNKIGHRVTFAGEKSLKNIAESVTVYSIPATELNKSLAQTSDHKTAADTEKPIRQQKRPFSFLKSRTFIIISTLLIVLLAGYFTFRPLVLKALMSNNPVPIAVISFENQTGDSRFDYLQKAIPNLLITNLEQSNLFQVMTWERMQDLLQQMGKEDVRIIDPSLGFEICRREGCNLIVIGSYVKAGETFVTDVKILDVHTKQLIKSVSARGTGEESILKLQIDQLSRDISGSAGIPGYRLGKGEMHVMDVTTSSLAAYDLFLEGREAFDKMYYDDAREYFEKALELDSTFAVAWLYLSNASRSLQNTQMQFKAIENAYKYSARATEKEQLFIKAVYARIIQNNPAEELRILKELTSKFPREKQAFYSLGVWYCTNNKPDEAIVALNKALDLDPRYSEAMNQIAYQYMKKGMYGEALRFFRKYVSICPDDANPHDSMGDLLWQTGKLDEAISEFSQALEIKPDFLLSAGKIGYVYAMKEDYPKAHQWLDNAIEISPSSGTRSMWHWVKAWMYNWCGDDETARKSLEMTHKLAAGDGNEFIIGGVHWLTAFMDVDAGHYIEAKAKFDKAFQIFLKYTTDPAVDSATRFAFNATLSLAEGKADEASRNLGHVQRLIRTIDPTGNDFIRYWSECIEVAMLLDRNDFKAALEKGQLIKPPELPGFEFPQVLIYNIPMEHDLVARAYAGLGMTAEAIIEYEKLITFDPGSTDRRLINPVYHFRLAKLYEAAGRPENAQAQYRKFHEISHKGNMAE